MFACSCLLVRQSVSAIAAMLAVSAAALAQPPADTLATAKAALSLTDGAVVNLDIDRTLGRALSVSVPFNGQMHTLELVPNSIRTPDYQLLEVGADGLARPAKAGPENSLIGRVTDIPGAEIAGGMMPDGLYCTILLPDGSRYWIEAIESRVAGARPGDHALYRGEDVVRGGQQCGGAIDPVPSFVPRTSFQARDLNLYTATVACDADYEFWAQYGNSTLAQNRITLVLNTMNLQYRRDVNIKHTVGTILVRTTAGLPYTQTYASPLLTQVRDEWEANQTGITRNVVQMFTGKHIDDFENYIGLAWSIGHICDNQAYCFVWSNFNNNFSSATDLSAHELGHLWGACHCSCDGPTRVSRYTMNPAITSINRFGPGGANSTCGNPTVTEITSYRATRYAGGSGCLGTSVGGETPMNDACEDAIPLASSAIMAMGNVFATTDGPASSCRNFAGKDVWYTLTAPCDGTLTIDTCSSSFDTVLTVYTGTCAALTEVACNDDDTTGTCAVNTSSRLTMPVTLGVTYRIKLSGYSNATGTGYFNVNVSGCGVPINNGCTWFNNIDNGVPVSFSTIGATTDGNADTLCNASGNSQIFQDLWFLYQHIPCSGPVRVATCNADFDTRIAIYTTSCPGPDTALACNDDNGPACSGTHASLVFNADTDHTYIIRVGGYLGAVGTGTLTVDSLSCPHPSNDDCASAIVVQNGSSVVSDFFAATNDGACTCGAAAASRDIWYSFTAPANGFLTVNTCGTNDLGGTDTGVDAVLSIHAGCPGDASNQIAGGCNDDAINNLCGNSDNGAHHDSSLTVALTFGQSVRIRLANYNNATPPNKQVKLNVSFAPANDECNTAIAVVDGLRSWYNSNAVSEPPTLLGGACGFTTINNDVWYSYVPTCTGSARVSLCGTPFDTLLAVYSGSCGTLGNPIACNDDNGVACTGSASSVDFPTVAGQTYLVRAGSYSAGTGGAGFMSLYCTAAAPGACCSGSTCAVAAPGACAGAMQHFAGAGTVCNAQGNNTTACCRADFNQSGGLEVQDIFDYLNAWFASNPNADINGSGLAVQDIFDYLNAWFAGC